MARLSVPEWLMVVTSAPAFVFIGYAGRILSPWTITLLRQVVGAAVMTAVWLVVRARRPVGQRASGLRRSDFWRVLASGVLGYTAYSALVAFGQHTVAPGIASLIANSSPVIITAIGILVLRERVSVKVWTGVGVGFCGTALVALGGSSDGGSSAWWGLALILGSALALAWYTVVQQPLLRHADPIAVGAAVMSAAVIPSLLMAPAAVHDLSSGGSVQASVVDGGSLPSLSQAVLAVVILGVTATAVGYGTWIVSLARLGATGGSVAIFLIPVLTMVLSVVLLGEKVSVLAAVGGAMALAGVVLARREGATEAAADGPGTLAVDGADGAAEPDLDEATDAPAAAAASHPDDALVGAATAAGDQGRASTDPVGATTLTA